MNDRVLILQVYTTADLELITHEMQSILREIKRWCRWVREHRLQTFVIITDESPLELRNRLFDVIVGKPGIGGLYCFTAPDDLVGNYAEWEGLRFHISNARLEVGERNRSNDLRNAQRRMLRRKGTVQDF